MERLEYTKKIFQMVTIADVFDILIVAYLLYLLMRFLRRSSAQRLLQGLLLLVIILPVSDYLQLHTLNYILSNVMQIGIIALVIIFQPELRKMLESVGSGQRIKDIFFRSREGDEVASGAIRQIVEAVAEMSRTRTGALIVFERGDPLAAICNTGSTIDAAINAELVKNIFFPKAALHDGAMIIQDFRIRAAGCILPLSGNPNISKELGTRHRAGLGVSENYDCVVVIVSEETGAISMAEGGMLKRHLAPETLEKLLTRNLLPSAAENGDRSLRKALGRLFRKESKTK